MEKDWLEDADLETQAINLSNLCHSEVTRCPYDRRATSQIGHVRYAPTQ
jgi:hypothetical protein